MKPLLTWDDFFGLQRFGMTRNLDNIRRFCKRLDHPEGNYPAVLVGGTNGKGTVVAALDSVLRSAGLKVGRYTSPHILSFGERIHITGTPISDEEVFAFLAEHWDFIREHHCTFFEVSTAMALDAFRRGEVDIAVVEVGLGGTYDATGVVDSILSIITPIDYDHTDRLGSDLQQIAADKAGIFRSGRKALICDQQPEVANVLINRAEVFGATLYRTSDVVEFSPLSVTPRGITGAARISRAVGDVSLSELKFPLTGFFQIENLKAALGASCLLADEFPGIDGEAIQRGIEHVSWPGRLQEIEKKPTLIVDVGHNPGAVREVLLDVRRIWKPSKIAVIFSALRDKDVIGMMEILKGEADRGFIVPLPAPRGLDVEEIETIANQVGWVADSCLSAGEAINLALTMTGERDLILVIGSHLLVEEVLKNQKYS